MVVVDKIWIHYIPETITRSPKKGNPMALTGKVIPTVSLDNLGDVFLGFLDKCKTITDEAWSRAVQNKLKAEIY